MRTIYVREAMRIPLGKQGENAAARVVWADITEKYEKLYGDGRFELVVAQGGNVYPAATTIDGADLVWVVRAADTATAGYGSLELIYYVGDTIAKSQTWGTAVVASASAAGTTEPPDDPARAWFEEIRRQIGDLGQLTTKAKENLVSAINEAAQTGSGGGSVEMRVDGGYIQYSTNGATWDNLIAVAELEGKPGKDGAPGKDGENGADGKDGLTPTIGANGNWYIGDIDTKTPSRGEKGEQGEQGIQGEKGAPGAKGADGPAGADGVTPNIQIGTVETLAPGSDATATITGTAAEPLLNLGIPQGSSLVSLGIAGATPGQIAKIAAVDDSGKPTAWSPVDMPSGGDLRWIEVVDITTEEQTQMLTISVDKDGRPISQYNALGMIFTIFFPADATQTSNNGSPWIYPFPKTGDSSYRHIDNISAWKTIDRTRTLAWEGLPRIRWTSGGDGQATFDTDGDPDFLSGVCVYLNSSGDHIPVGTKVRIAVLSRGITM